MDYVVGESAPCSFFPMKPCISEGAKDVQTLYRKNNQSYWAKTKLENKRKQ